MRRLRGVRWLLVAWVFVLSAVSYLDRVNISVGGKFIAQEYGLDPVRLGNVFSAFLLGYALFQAPGGRLADRFGPRAILTIAGIWWAIFTALTGLVPSGGTFAFALLLSVRFALGVGEAVVYPASNRFVSKWIPAAERGLANGIIFAGVGVGAAVAPPFVTALIQDHGWRVAFYGCALVGVVAAGIWWIVGRDTPGSHPWITPGEVAVIGDPLPATVDDRPVAWSTIARSRSVRALTLGYATFGYAAWIFFTWFFNYLNAVRGMNLKASGYYAMLPFVAMAIASPLGGWVGDRLSVRYGARVGRRIVGAGGMLLAAGFIAIGVQVESAALATVVLAGGAGGLYFSLSSFWSVSADLGGASAGAVSGLMNMGNQIAGVVTASLTPWLAVRFGWNLSFLVAAALCAVGAAAWWWIEPAERLKPR